ncbi:tetratricopeptide repeat protein [Cupriavidus metallidurans]|uniref:O-linked N-acetylglucosamine transferase, SPINDLY family protein n=1 Tax=Cupriavidus metallidurans TaxID=119219 RepID=UPI00164585EA|nr:tetratricopeptide repeat protein [Cupriavidus metallidurans]
MHDSYHAVKASNSLAKAEASFKAHQYDECIRNAERADKHGSDSPRAYFLRAVSCLRLGNRNEALRLSEQGLARFPEDIELRVVMGETLMTIGRYPQARAALEPVIAQNPPMWQAWATWSSVLYGLQDYPGARDAALRGRALAPKEVSTLTAYANAMKETGKVGEAVGALREAIAIAPDQLLLRFNLLFTMLFDENTTGLDLRHEAERCAQLMIPAKRGARALHPPADNGRIRLGLMSNDLMSHACAYFVIPFLANLDHTRVEVFVYSLNGHADNITEKVRYFAGHFVELAGKTVKEVVDIVRADQLDVLFDLGGYTRNTPLTYMAHGLAMKQLTWIGYPGTTGMPGMDYRLTEAMADPEGNEAFCTEELLHAPAIASYFPLVARPLDAYAAAYRVRPTPALENGHITFGCCINLAKISARTLRLWSGVLARCPGSRLLVECSGLDNDAVRVPLLERMAAAGIAAERVICVPREGKNQYVLYHRIDVLLDTAPLTAGANACDALWMGVPLVTIAGQAFHERISASFLNTIGLPGLICTTDDQYIETAVALASDVAQLDALRMSIRTRFEGSALSDAAGLCRWLEEEMAKWVSAYRTPGQIARPDGEGLFFGGRWISMEEIATSLVGIMATYDTDALANLLENVSAKWSKHWLVAYALSELLYQQGDKAGALDLLIDSAMLRKYSLPLYRLLLARLDELGQDKSALAAFLQESFGLDAAVVEAMPVPTIHEITGVPARAEQADEVAA